MDAPGVIHEWPSGMSFQQMMDVALATFGPGSPEVVNLSLTYDPQPAPQAPLPVFSMVGVGALALALFVILNRTM